MPRKKRPREPWERQPKETDPAWEAFQLYRDMGEKRSITKVSQKVDKNRVLIGKWSRRHEWRDRVKAFGEWTEDIKRDAKEKALRAQSEREVEEGTLLQLLGRGQLTRYQPQRVVDDEGVERLVYAQQMTAAEARLCIVDGAKLVKSGLGEPESRTAVDVNAKGLTFADLAEKARNARKERSDNDA